MKKVMERTRSKEGEKKRTRRKSRQIGDSCQSLHDYSLNRKERDSLF